LCHADNTDVSKLSSQRLESARCFCGACAIGPESKKFNAARHYWRFALPVRGDFQVPATYPA